MSRRTHVDAAAGDDVGAGAAEPAGVGAAAPDHLRPVLGFGDAVEAEEDEADAGEEVAVVVVRRRHGGWTEGGTWGRSGTLDRRG
jgi:hypothetical protein